MKISAQAVASFHYTLKDEAGEVIDSSEGQPPLSYLHGANNIVPGLEKELDGKAVGDRFTVVVAPAEGYGEVDTNLQQAVPRSMFTGVDTIEPGMQFHAQTEHGPQSVTVIKVEDDTVTIDSNHPLAGKALHFDIEITDIRDATAEEMDHGRAQVASDNEA